MDVITGWDGAEELGVNNGYMYLAIMPENDTEGMEEGEKAQYEECKDYIKKIKETLAFTDIEEKTGLNKMPIFTTKDLKGNTVTENIFKEKDIEGEDDQEHKDKAVEIMEKAGADFTNIIPGSEFSALLGEVAGVPTTIFVDKEGNITGKPIVGANVPAYKKFVEDYISGK